MQKITPFLWFDDKAEEAMNFYFSIFKNSKVISVTRYGEVGPGPKGSVMTASQSKDFKKPSAHFRITCAAQPLQPPHAGDSIGLEIITERMRNQARRQT